MGLFILPASERAVAGLRTVSARRAACAVGALLLAAVAGGAVLGYQAGERGASLSTAAAPALDADGERVLTERIGTLQGRLLQLETRAKHLATRVGRDAQAADEPSGGPFIPMEPGGDAGSVVQRLRRLEFAANRLEGLLAEIADGAAMRGMERLALPSRLPVANRRISSGFGRRMDPITGRWARHTGIDMPAPSGTPIMASAGGRVRFAGFRAAYGNTVEIDHGNGLVTRYAHARRLHVRRGDLVLPGQTIAQVGSTGRSTGAHLHFEVLRHGIAVEPRRYLAGRDH